MAGKLLRSGICLPISFALPQIPSDSESMLRKQLRRSFTVEVKKSATSGLTYIPAKPPRFISKARSMTATSNDTVDVLDRETVSSGSLSAQEPRRILPNLVTWEPSSPEPEYELVHEAPLPRVRRVIPAQAIEGASRPRGRPRKTPEAAPSTPIQQQVEPSPMIAASPNSSAQVRALRGARPDADSLSRAERWKRRLPRACW